MTDTVFVPITCAGCLRTSALGLATSELEQKLFAGESIELRCGFDGRTWEASPRERARVAKFYEENKAIPRRFDLKVEPLRDSI